MTPGAVVVAEGLSRHYGRVRAVDGLSFTVGRGELFGLVGPDGAGKTTTQQMLAGLLRPTAGRATVLGFDLATQAAEIQSRVGVMSEGFTLYGTLSVGENLRFFADLYGLSQAEREARIERLLTFSRLGPFIDREARSLSGGMKKKLALSCALLYRPSLLLLDEPTTGVDPVSRQEFWAILGEFLADGRTIILTTPYMDEAERCHRVALLDRGRLLAVGSPQALVDGIGMQVLAVLSDRPDAARHTLVARWGEERVERHGNWIDVLTPRAEADRGIALADLEAAGLVVRRVFIRRPSIEDVFIHRIRAERSNPDSTAGLREVAPNRNEPASPPVVIDARGLSKRFGSFQAVREVDLTVRQGEIFGLLGPNGAGKSTTIRMLCGLLDPSAGAARVAGYDVGRDPHQVREHIGYMSQKFSLYRDLTVLENLEFFGRLYGLPDRQRRSRRDWALQMAGLIGRERVRAKSLAGGWKQRLALGAAVLHEPPVLFLDEPTAGVDPVARRQFWRLIDQLAADGMTILVTTHYMDEAEQCHRLAFILDGRLIATGTPDELKEATSRGEMWVVAIDQPAAALLVARDLGLGDRAGLLGARLRLETPDRAEIDATLIPALQRAGVSVLSVEASEPTLEDVFERLMRQRQEVER